MADLTVLYFKASNEVFKISTARNGKPARDWTGQFDVDFVGQLDDPTLVDFTLPHEFPRNAIGKLIGADGSLICDPVGNSVRLAIQTEYDTFDASRLTMEQQAEAKEAVRRISISPRYRKIFKALLKRILQVTNNQASQINGIKAAISTATSLAEVKTAIDALPALNDSITLEQAVTALLNDVSSDD